MINKVILIGRLGRDPEVRKVSEKITVANFPLGTSEKYKDRDGQSVERTEWTNITVWGTLAEIVEKYFKKGMLVYVEGKLRTESYEKNGMMVYSTKVISDVAQILERKKEEEPANRKEENSTYTHQESYQPKQKDPQDNIPF